MPKRHGEHLSVIDGDLVHIDRSGKVHPNQYSDVEKRRFYQGLLYLTLSRGQKPGAAAYRYKDRFGDWPARSWSYADPLPPTPEVAAWDRHCRIKYAKAMKKVANG
jgi:hypothetical protein